jgi:undecaprenol kinase
MFNTAIEAVVDLFCGDRLHPLAKAAKDTAAGAVLMTAFGACIVGYWLFFRRLAALFL